MARTLLLVSLFVGSGSLFLGCTQDFNVFKPGAGGAGTSSASGSTTTVSTTATSSSSSTGTGGAPQCTTTDLSKCDDNNICTTESCVAGECKSTPVADGLAPGYTDTPTDCVDDICTAGVLKKNAPDDTEIPDDMNLCTTDTCSGGTPMHTPTNSGGNCGGTNVCDNMGNCVGCTDPTQCTGMDTECKIRTCSAAHVCGTMNIHEGLPVTTGQTAGDCHTINCVNGTATNQVDDTDKPDDGNVCTMDICTAGTPSHMPEGVAHTCGAVASCPDMGHQKAGDHCDGAGACAPGSTTPCMGEFKCTGTSCATTCTMNTQCQSGFVCDNNVGSANIHTCVQCAANGDCGGATPICDLGAASTNFDKCVECTASTTCMNDKAPKATVCQTTGALLDTCSCTMDADCKSTFSGACIVATGKCGCNVNGDCASTMCDTTNHVCM